MKINSAFAAGVLLLWGCDPVYKDKEPDGSCTAEYRINFCVTINGFLKVQDTLLVIRSGASDEDTLAHPHKPYDFGCFGEKAGTFSVRVEQKGVKVGEVSGIAVEHDGCHAKALRVDVPVSIPVREKVD